MDNEFNPEDKRDFSGFWHITTFQPGREDNAVFKTIGCPQSYEGVLADVKYLVEQKYQPSGEFHIECRKIGKTEIVLFNGLPKLKYNGEIQ